MHHRLITLLVVAILGLGLTGLCYGQAGDTSKGSLSVDVLDSSGAVVPAAKVVLSGPMGDRTASSNERGQAIFYGIAPGTYKVRVELKGFRTAEVPGLNVNANQRTPIQVKMEPGAVTETITVSEEAARIDTTTTTTGAILEQANYANLPIARNISALFSMAPGAAPSGDPVLNNNPSISGSTGLENQYIIDGISTTDQGYGAFGVFAINYGSLGAGVNSDFVKEVQIKTGGFEAQYGQALGGVINVVTESGGNEVHGAVYAYSAPGFAEGTYKQPNDSPRISSPQTETVGRHAWDAGFNVGGPFKKNKAFWYGSFNPSFSTIAQRGPLNYGTRDMDPQEGRTKTYAWIGKLNYNLTDSHRLEATGFGDPSRWPSQINGVGGSVLVRDDLDSKTSAIFGSRNWAVKYNGMFTKTTLFNTSFSWNHTYFEETPEKNIFRIRNYGLPKPNGAYTYTGGAGFIANTDGDTKQFSWMLTQNFNALGSHQVDLGYAYSNVPYTQTRYYTGPDYAVPDAPGVDPADVGKIIHGGFFYFYPTRTVAGTVQQNVYRNSRGDFGDPSFATLTKYQDAFIQDAWQVNKYLTAKLGLRWEQQFLQGMVNTYTFAANWAPRLGFIIDPTGSRKTKIYGNWGRFFEKIPQDIAARSMSAEQSYYLEYTYALPPTAENLVPGSSFSPYAVDPTILAGGTKAMYQTEMVAGVERELPGGVVLTTRFIHRNVNRIIEDVSGITVEQANAGTAQPFVITNPSASLDLFQNAVPCTDGPDCTSGSGFTDNSGLVGPDGKPDGFPDPRRVYKALEITVDKRFSHGWSFMGNYRLAKLFGNYEGLFRNDNGQSDPNVTSSFDFVWSEALADQFKVGVLPTDRRHVVNAYANYMIKNGLNVGFGWQAMSGTPISKFNAHPAYLNAGEVPVGGRGAYGRTAFENYFDTRVDYTLPLKSDTYKLKLASDMFNIFNRKTTTYIDQNAELSPGTENKDFLKPFRMHRPYYVRFSVRLEF